MSLIRKCLICAVFAFSVFIGSGPLVLAQSEDVEPEAEVERLYAQLAEPGREDWERVEAEIERIWSRSGSDSMDLLLERGREALNAQDYDTALHYFSALTDHAPGFAEGWNGRATTFYLMEEFALSISDIEHVLALNPRHFGALQGLGIMFEQLGENELSLNAFRAANALHPNQPDVKGAIERLERSRGAVDL